MNELKFAGIKPKKMEIHGNLVLVDGYRRKPVWASNIWTSVERISFESVADATRRLKEKGLRWAPLPSSHHRRVELISKGLRVPKFTPFRFPDDAMPTKKLGSFVLLSENEMLASAECSQTIPHGEAVFVEDKDFPPTRAYLKLFEAFTRLGQRPQAGAKCIDLGACPGGWTWVIAKLGASVVSVDRASIVPEIEALPGVEFIQANAFTLDPKKFEHLDWIFSDVICEPTKLLDLAHRWLVVHPDANFIFSVKFKGDTDFRVMNAFQKIPGSTLVHLSNNKHEVTWIRLKPVPNRVEETDPVLESADPELESEDSQSDA